MRARLAMVLVVGSVTLGASVARADTGVAWLAGVQDAQAAFVAGRCAAAADGLVTMLRAGARPPKPVLLAIAQAFEWLGRTADLDHVYVAWGAADAKSPEDAKKAYAETVRGYSAYGYGASPPKTPAAHAAALGAAAGLSPVAGGAEVCTDAGGATTLPVGPATSPAVASTLPSAGASAALPPLKAAPAKSEARPGWFRTIDPVVLIVVSVAAASAVGLGIYSIVALR